MNADNEDKLFAVSFLGIIVVSLLAGNVATSGCMGIEMPVIPQNMMKMNVPVAQNPVQIQNAYVPRVLSNGSGNQTNITVISTTKPRFVYV